MASTYTNFDKVNATNIYKGGVEITSTAAELNALDGIASSVTELDEFVLTSEIVDVSTAGQVYIPVPYAGTVQTIYSALGAVITTANAVLTAKVGGATYASGTITIAHTASAVGQVGSMSPTAMTIAAGEALEIETNGASTITSQVGITAVIRRT